MCADRASDTNSAEEQRDEPDQVEKAVKILERCAEILFAFGDGIIFEPEALHLRRQFADALLAIHAFGKLNVIAVMRDAARLQQIRPRNVLQPDVNTRSE